MLPEFGMLFSFAEKGVSKKIKAAHAYCKDKVDLKIFLDSGAFTAFNLGKPIKLAEYANFVFDHLRYVDVYANLDEVNNEEGTRQNQYELERRGLDPLPVMHYGSENWYWEDLARYYKYIAIGGTGVVGPFQHKQFTELAMAVMLKINPTLKVHGFGVTNPFHIVDIPYYSIDSTSWVSSRYGNLRLWNPRIKQFITWQRPQSTGLVKKLPLLRETLHYYGLEADDYLARQNVWSYNKASIKAYIALANFIKETQGRHLRIYFVGVPAFLLKEEGFFDYLFSPLEEAKEEVITEKQIYGRGTSYRPKRIKKLKVSNRAKAVMRKANKERKNERTFKT